MFLYLLLDNSNIDWWSYLFNHHAETQGRAYADTGLTVNFYGSDLIDWMKGDDGSDFMYGNGGDDRLWGYGNDDFLVGGDGNDHLYGGDGDDTIRGDSGVDFSYGGDGADYIGGGSGDDASYGGDGDDHLYAGEGADYVDGGADIDTMYYWLSDTGIELDLDSGVGHGGYAEGDTVLNVENVHGSFHDDQLYGNGVNNGLDGEQGDDLIRGGGGNDVIAGGRNAVTGDDLWGDDGDDRFEFLFSDSGGSTSSFDRIWDFDQFGDDLLSFQVHDRTYAESDWAITGYNDGVNSGAMIWINDTIGGVAQLSYQVALIGSDPGDFGMDDLAFM